MSLGGAMHQKPGPPGRTGAGRGEAVSEAVSDEATLARDAQTDCGVDDLLGQALTRENMAAAWKRVKANKADKRVLRLIRRYLQAGLLVHGVLSERFEGTPQGGPLSPLLANVLLDAVDQVEIRSPGKGKAPGMARMVHGAGLRTLASTGTQPPRRLYLIALDSRFIVPAAAHADRRAPRRRAVALRHARHRTPASAPASR